MAGRQGKNQYNRGADRQPDTVAPDSQSSVEFGTRRGAGTDLETSAIDAEAHDASDVADMSEFMDPHSSRFNPSGDISPETKSTTSI